MPWPAQMGAQPARPASVAYLIGADALTPAAVRLIIKRTARRAAEKGLVSLFGKELDAAIVFAPVGELVPAALRVLAA